MWKKAVILFVALLSIESLLIQAAQGKDYPVRTIEIVTFQAAGSGFDIISRLIAEHFSKYLGQSVIVVNKPGGAGTYAAADVVNSKPDGHKLLVCGVNYFAFTVKTQKVPFDPRNLIPIATFSEFSEILYVKGDSPWKSLDDLLKYGKENQGKLRWAHPGRGLAPVHVSPYLLFRKTGIQTIDLPYKGSAEMLAACLGGHVDMASGPYTPVKENIRAKQIRGLVVWADQRSSDPADVPCQVELGFPKVWSLNSSLALFAHKETPENIKNILINTSEKVSREQEFRDALERVGARPKFGGPEYVNQKIKNGEEVGVPILKELGLYVE